jgi:hypothetical protein
VIQVELFWQYRQLLEQEEDVYNIKSNVVTISKYFAAFMFNNVYWKIIIE